MILGLLKRALKAVLHQATEEFAIEVGVPESVVTDMRTERLALEAQRDAEADARAAAALGVDDEEVSAPAVLIVRSAAQVTTEVSEDHDAPPTPQPSSDGKNPDSPDTTAEPEEENQPSLPLPASPDGQAAIPRTCPTPDAGQDALLAWVQLQREQNVNWGEVTRIAKDAGHSMSTNALKKRVREGRE